MQDPKNSPKFQWDEDWHQYPNERIPKFLNGES